MGILDGNFKYLAIYNSFRIQHATIFGLKNTYVKLKHNSQKVRLRMA